MIGYVRSSWNWIDDYKYFCKMISLEEFMFLGNHLYSYASVPLEASYMIWFIIRLINILLWIYKMYYCNKHFYRFSYIDLFLIFQFSFYSYTISQIDMFHLDQLFTYNLHSWMRHLLLINILGRRFFRNHEWKMSSIFSTQYQEYDVILDIKYYSYIKLQ